MKNLLKLTITLMLCTLFIQQLSASTVKKYYSIKEFSKLKISSAFQVEFIHSNENKVEVEIDEDDADDVFVGNADGTLTIKLKDYGNYNTSVMKATVYGNSLSGIFISGASHFSSTHTFKEKEINIKTSGASRVEILLETELLDLDISGASKLTVKGTAAKQTIDISGASNYNGKNCSSNDVNIDASGASKATLNCSNILDAEASGASHVTYLNEPKKVNKSTSGASEVEAH